MPESGNIHRNIHWGDQGKDVKIFQQTEDDFARQFDQLLHFHVTPDGKAGKYTFGAAHRSAYIMGLPQSRLDEIAGKGSKHVITERTQNLLRHPELRSDGEKHEAAKRRETDRKKHQQARDNAANLPLVTFDGHQVAGWIVRSALQPARADGVYFVCISGFRDPAYSEHLCYVMCGAPSCPGQCAGSNSNHSCPPSHKCVEFEGAVDLSPPQGMYTWTANHGFPIRHVLANDANHFSRSGY